MMRLNQDSQVKIMEPSHQEQRHAAAKYFQESLNQLQQILEENQTEEEKPELDIVDTQEDDTAIDLAAFEDAVADIEQYLSQKRSKSQD